MSKTRVKRQPASNEKKGRPDRRLIVLSKVLSGVAFALLAAAIILAIFALTTDSNGALADELPPLEILFAIVGIILANGIVGLLIISRYSDHVIGWLLLILSFCFALATSAEGCSALQLSRTVLPGPSAQFFVWIEQWIWYPIVIIPLFFIPLFFPNGQLLSPRWRFAPIAGVVGLVAGMVGTAIDPYVIETMNTVVGNPFAIAGGAAVADFLSQYVALPLLAVSLLGAIGSLLLRYRRADAIQRAQLKWVFYTLVLGISVSTVTNNPVLRLIASESTLENLSSSGIWLTITALPVVIGIAILRYRLYDIDIIIRRTLVYSLVTLTLAVVYFGSVVLLQRLFTRLSGEQSSVAIVISTLIIAALFSPLRRRVQGFIDRRFYRRRYDTVKTLAAFGAVARDEVDLQTLRQTLLAVVEETMQPAQLSLWMAPSADRSAGSKVAQRVEQGRGQG